MQVVELTGDSTLQQQCIQGPQRKTCFLAFLPALLDTQAAGRRTLIQVMLACDTAVGGKTSSSATGCKAP